MPSGSKVSAVLPVVMPSVTAQEMAEILTHAAFYAGWPKAWAAFRMAKEVYEG